MEERPELRFLVDLNVGRLVKWLRAMGYDAVMVPATDDGELVRLALREGRVVLTKDARFCQRRVVASGLLRAVLVRSDTLREQLRQVVAELGLSAGNGFTRCLRCNHPLRAAPREEVAPLVPPYVRRTQQEFCRCPACGRIYWRGTHWANMRRELAEALRSDP